MLYDADACQVFYRCEANRAWCSRGGGSVLEKPFNYQSVSLVSVFAADNSGHLGM